MLSCLLCNFFCLYLSLPFLKIKERAAYPAHSSTPYSIKQKLKSKLNVPMTIISLRIEKVKKNKERTLVRVTVDLQRSNFMIFFVAHDIAKTLI